MTSLSRRSLAASILCFTVAAPIITFFAWLVLGPAALMILLASHLFFLFPTLVANCQWWGPVVTEFHTSNNEVWLTIDDGPDEQDTPRLLDLFDLMSVRVTFFLIGDRLQRLPDLGAEIIRRGHSIANHTQTHPSGLFWSFSARKMQDQISKCNLVISGISKHETALFRAPAGLKNPFLHPILRHFGMVLVGWTVRGLDTLSQDADGVSERILRQVRPGAIVLLHEGLRRESNADFSLQCVEKTLRGLTERGYRCIIPDLDQLRPHPCGRQTNDC